MEAFLCFSINRPGRKRRFYLISFFLSFIPQLSSCSEEMRKITGKQMHLSKISVHCVKTGAGAENLYWFPSFHNPPNLLLWLFYRCCPLWNSALRGHVLFPELFNDCWSQIAMFLSATKFDLSSRQQYLQFNASPRRCLIDSNFLNSALEYWRIRRENNLWSIRKCFSLSLFSCLVSSSCHLK